MQSLLESLKTYLKNNWAFLAVMLIGSTIILAQMSQVVLYADDYSLGIYSSGGIKSAFDYFTNHYMTWGGGYTSFLVILLFGMGNVVWQIFLASLLIIFVLLTVKMICKNHPKSKWLTAAILWACIFILSIWVSRETIYWLDGGVAYLFSAFQVFILFYLVYTRLIQDVHKKYDLVLLPIASFFAGWSSAQSGLIAVLIPILIILWQHFVRKTKVTKLFYITAILSLIGFLIFYLAPGNSVRMNEFEFYNSLNLFEKIAYRSNSVFGLILEHSDIEFSAAPFFIYLTIGLTAIVDLNSIKQEKSKKLKITRLCCSIYSLLFLLTFLISTLGIPFLSSICQYCFKYLDLLKVFSGEYGMLGYLGILPYLAATIAILSNLILAFSICKRHNNPFLITTLLAGYIAEFCMVMAPYSPIRTTFYTITFMWLAIGYLIVTSKAEKIGIFPITIIIFTIFNFYLGIVSLICYLILRSVLPNILPEKKISFPTVEILLFTAILSILAIINSSLIFVNYHRNKVINTENNSRIIEYKTTNNTAETLYLVQPYNELYGFTGLAGIEWVERAVNLYFELPTELNLEYEGISQ